MKAIELVMAGLLLTPNVGAEPPVAPSPPPPELVDAFIGFERNPEQPAGLQDQVWYYRYALQIQGDSLAWHRDDAICKDGRMLSSEGDGASLHYRGRIEGPVGSRTAKLDYLSCDLCLDPAKPARQVELPIAALSPQRVRMGAVVYRKDVAPYPDRCPELPRPPTDHGAGR